MTETTQRDLETLAETNIAPVDNKPFMWKIGNKLVTAREIETIMEVQKEREATFKASLGA